MSEIAAAIERSDYVRLSPASVGGASGHKEWQHFVVLTPGLDLLVNFSLCDEAGAGAAAREAARIVVLVREREWDGDVETFAPDAAVVRRGCIDLRFAANRLAFRAGAFATSVRLRERPIALDLELRPVTLPAFVPNVPMLDGPPLHWLVVPRLAVTGTVTVAGRTHRLDGAPAYHDHNWGHFLWGHDVSWEWGFVLPDDAAVPWGLTFVRLMNRTRTVALAQKMLLWRDQRMVAVFRERDVRVRTSVRHLRPRRLFKIPRPMALVAPELSCDVPRAIGFRGAMGADRVEVHCDCVDVAQVLIPSETRLGVTIFNEVLARATVRGVVGGEPFEFAGRSILEFIRDA